MCFHRHTYEYSVKRNCRSCKLIVRVVIIGYKITSIVRTASILWPTDHNSNDSARPWYQSRALRRWRIIRFNPQDVHSWDSEISNSSRSIFVRWLIACFRPELGSPSFFFLPYKFRGIPMADCTETSITSNLIYSTYLISTHQCLQWWSQYLSPVRLGSKAGRSSEVSSQVGLLLRYSLSLAIRSPHQPRDLRSYQKISS